ncbi:MAG: helix-turn-helix transcriptional regulator [Steroidobacter sp.]
MQLDNTQPPRVVGDRIVAELSPAPVAKSVDRPWAGMTVHLHDWPAGGTVISPEVDHDIIAMRVSGAVRLKQRRVGKEHLGLSIPGNVTVHPRGYESRWNWDRPGAIMLARVPQDVLVQAADANFTKSNRVELQNCFGARDEFIEPIMGLFARELQQPQHPVQELIAGYLSCALAGHLVQRFNVQRVNRSSDPAGLEPQALRRVLDVMHAQATAISLTGLAEIAGVSRFHFARMFRRSTGETPMAYLERVRLERAQRMIQEGEHTLAEIAAAVGYADQAHFTRRFRRYFGCTPAVYARHQASSKLPSR